MPASRAKWASLILICSVLGVAVGVESQSNPGYPTQWDRWFLSHADGRPVAFFGHDAPHADKPSSSLDDGTYTVWWSSVPAAGPMPGGEYRFEIAFAEDFHGAWKLEIGHGEPSGSGGFVLGGATEIQHGGSTAAPSRGSVVVPAMDVPEGGHAAFKIVNVRDAAGAGRTMTVLTGGESWILPPEPVAPVERGTPTSTLRSSRTGAGHAPGVAVHASVTVSGAGPQPGGTVAFFLCGPSEVELDTCPASAGTPVGGPRTLQDGAATSPATDATRSLGRHCWRATYSGDASYHSTQAEPDGACFTVGFALMPGAPTTCGTAVAPRRIEQGQPVTIDRIPPSTTACYFEARLPGGMTMMVVRFREVGNGTWYVSAQPPEGSQRCALKAPSCVVYTPLPAGAWLLAATFPPGTQSFTFETHWG